MKNLFLAFVASCWVCVSLNAQIVVTASNYGAFFNSGSTQITDTTPTISPGSAGANVAWNFAALNTHKTTSNSFMAASTGLKGSSFPLADVCLKQDTHYYYYDSSSTNLQYYGYAGNFLGINTNDAIVFSNPETILTFPSTYNTSFSDVSSYDNQYLYNTTYQGYFVDSIRQKSITTTTSVVDAWGTITTPNATMACLRQNISKHTIDTTWAKVFVGGFHYWIELYTDDATTQYYSYISNVGGGLIASIEYYADSNAIAEVRWNPVTLPVISLTSQSNVLCNGSNTGSATISATGGVTPYTYTWSNGQTGTTATGLTAGTYTATVEDAVNSTSSYIVTITEPSPLIATLLSQTNPSCAPCTDGTVSILASGGISPYSYSWSNGQTSSIITGLGVGNYTVTVADSNSCSVANSITIDTLMIIKASDYNTFFSPGNTLIIDTMPIVTPGASGANITWYLFSLNSHLIKNNSFMDPASGLNGSSFTNASVCMKMDTNYYYYDSTETSLNYWGFAGNILDIGTNDAIVYNNPETILTFPSTYNTSFTDVSSHDNSFLYNTTYQGYFVDSIRQKAITTTTSVIDGWGKVVTPNGTIPCLRQNIMKNTIDTTWAKIFVGGYHYWIELYNSNDNVQSYSYISNLGGGLIASIEFEPNSTVVAQATWNPIILPTASISAQTNVSCFGGADGSATVTAAGGTSPYTYLWGNGQTTATATGLSVGYHTVSVTDNLNGTATATVNISQPPLLVASITNYVNATCLACTDGSATVTGDGGTAPFTYLWSNGQTSSTSTGLGMGTASVTITDSKTCNTIISVDIDTLLVINSSDYTFFEFGTDLIIDTLPGVSPGSAGANVTWDLSALNTHLLSANTFMPPASGVLGGSYPNSNVCVNQDTLYNYFDTSLTRVEYYGTAGNILDNSTNNAQVYSNPATFLTFPLTYNTTFTDTAHHDNTYVYNALYQGVWVDSIREKETIITSSVIDGWGTIKTPNESFNGFRQNVTKHHIDSTWAKIFVGNYHYWIEVYNDTFNVQFYNYISDANGNNIVSIEYFADSNAIVEAKWNPMTLPVVTATSTDVTCNGINDGTATASVTGGTSPYTYSWNTTPVQTSATATGLAAGSYTVSILDAINNSSNVSVTISEPPALTATVSVNDASCSTPDGDATVTPAGGTTGYTYLWSNTQTTATATGLLAGSYMVTVTDANGCTDSVQAVVSNVGAPTIAQDSLKMVDCFGNANGIAYLSATGGTGTLTYLWNTTPGQSSSTATGLSAGTYTLSVTDASNCVSVESVTITQPTLLSATIISQTNVSCFGDSNGVATAGPVGGTSGYTYSWSTTPAQTTVTATGLKAGSFTVTVSDAKNCSTTAVATITQPATLTASLSTQTNVSCFGGSNGTATASGVNGTTPYSYVWNTTPAQLTATATGLSALSYTVTVTDANGCSNTTSTTITEPSALTASIPPPGNVSCSGGNDGSATVNASGGTTNYSYSWNTVPVQTTASATGLSLGIYTVTVTDANGCTITANATISEPAALNASITSQTDVSCFGDSNGVATVTPVGGSTGYTYSWSTNPAQLTATATGLKQGSYTVVVTDSKGCTKTASATISEPNALVAASVAGSIACFGGTTTDTVTATGGTSPYSGTGIFTISAGTATYTVTDANLCTSSTSVTVTEPTALVASSVAGTIACFGGTTTDTVTATGGTSPFSGTGVFTISAGTSTYTVTDNNGCTSTTSVTVTEPSALIASNVAGNILCNGGTTTDTVTAAGGTSPYSGTGIFTISAGTYSYTVTDANGCTNTTSVTVTEPSAISVSTSNTPSTCGNATGTMTATPTGGTGSYSYSWSNGGNTSTVTGVVSGSYSVIVTDANNCTASGNTIVNNSDGPNVSATTLDVLCNGGNTGSATAVVSGGASPYTYLWSNGQTSPTATGLAAGSQTVTVSDGNSCTGTASILINQPSAIITTATSTNSSCNGSANGTATVSATGGTSPFTYLWNNGQASAVATGLIAGSYTVSVTDSNACSQTATAIVTEPSVISLATSNTNATCGSSDGTASVTATGGTGSFTYLWSNSQTTATATGLPAGSYTVVVMDSNNCTATSPSIFVNNLNGPSVTVAPVNILCNGGTGSATATVTGGVTPYTYQWSGGQSTNPATGLLAGTNTLVVTDSASCITSSTFTISEPTALNGTTVATDPLCNGGTGSALANVSGGTSPYSYLWSGGQTTNPATGLVAGTVSVSITDNNGCIFSSSTTISEPGIVTAVISAETGVSCNGDSNGVAVVVAGGGTSGYTYNWNTTPAQTTDTASGLPGGTFGVTVTDANGCTQTASATISEPTVLSATASVTNDVSCFGGNDGSTSVSVSGGTTGYTYIWSNGSPNQTAGQLVAGTNSVTVTDANGCTATSSATVTEPTALTSTTSSTGDNGSANGTATVAASGGTTTYSYTWSTTPPQTTATATGLSFGTYTVTVTDANGCSITDTETILDVLVSPTAIINYSVSAYPNPSQGKFNLQVSSQVENVCNLVIYDIKGQLVFEQNIKLVSGISNYPVSINAAHQGIYVIQLTTKDGVVRIPVTVME